MFKMFLEESKENILHRKLWHLNNLAINPVNMEDFAKYLRCKFPKAFYVYTLIGPDGRPFYIGKGKTINNYYAPLRAFEHFKEARSGRQGDLYDHIRNLIYKNIDILYSEIGGANHEWMVMDFEFSYIKIFGRRNIDDCGWLFNKAAGYQGSYGLPLKEETKLKISQILKGRTINEEQRRNLSIALKNSEAHKAFHLRTRVPVKIHGILYSYIGEAAQILNIPRGTLGNYVYANKPGYERIYL